MITHENIISVGTLFILFGFLIIIFGSIFLGPKTATKYSFVGFIGPFPFGFGNDKKLFFLTLALGIILFLAFSLFVQLRQ